MNVTADSRFHMVMAMAYAKTAQSYMGIDWDTARCFVDLANEHWRRVVWTN